MLELYRSGDLEKLEAYEGRLGQLGIPILVLWGENDEYAPVAHHIASIARFRTRSSWSSRARGTSCGRTIPSAARAR
jgi:pimeloyl-ACP methyl ester carboxylesterase